MSGWIGVDLDGTLAYYTGWQGLDKIGEPIPEMLRRVLIWRAAGEDVRIFTARVSAAQDGYSVREIEQFIREWCKKHIGEELPVTCIKDMSMRELWDDRAVQVIPNTGKPVLAS